MDEEEEAEVKAKLSKKAKKAANKLSIAELKAIAAKPELIEWTDPDAADPRLLISIKSQRNVVPVPGHWALKREYLSSKRGIEKPPFALPKFIQETGIAEMRDAILEKQAEASLKQKQRERVQGKMGKLDMDYNKLYEAFFRRQTKPEMTRFGEVYYEGKEYETNLKHMRPGELSEDLKDALNIPPGAPPPWLINQQRFGPPLSYPSLKIPGLNAPPPPGQTWGFHPGGYGKPPLDEFNRPLYGGDVFGTAEPHQNQSMGEPVEKTIWGELRPPGESEDEESEEEEEDEEDEDVDEEQGDGMQAPGGTATPSGIASTMPSEYGGETSIGGEFTLRKQRRGTETEESAAPRSAYQVLPEQNIRAQGFFGGDRKYDLQGAPAPSTRNVPMLGENNRRKRKADDVEISVDPDVLARDDKLDKDALKKRYDAERKAAESRRFGGIDQDDLSAMIAEESHKRLKKDEERRGRR
jgi:splicing factor 3B subunit 2